MWTDVAARRIVLVVAHPDDETLAAGAHMKYWPKLTIVHVTDGAPRDGADARRAGFPDRRDYGGARCAELECALDVGEARHANRIALDLPDQQAILGIAKVIERLKRILGEAEVVITHCYEGGHPDHDACALACRAAAPRKAELWEFAGYHLRNGAIESGEFWGGDAGGFRFAIAGEDLVRKRLMLSCFRTQQETLAQFRDDVEAFRPAGEADFTKAPHEGPLLYETWGFELNGERWRGLARETLACR